jgi:large subunit ribosomal protein L16
MNLMNRNILKFISGGQLKYGHFEMIRQAINKKMDIKKAFAIWRVDPPWSNF